MDVLKMRKKVGQLAEAIDLRDCFCGKDNINSLYCVIMQLNMFNDLY